MNQIEIEKLIKELIENMAISVKEIVVSQEEGPVSLTSGPKTVWYSVAVSEPHFFTVREGEALASLNHLVRRIIESKMTPLEAGAEIRHVVPILIDIGDFQKKRVENIKAVAHMMAERARYFKSNVEIDPMTAFDRRIVHEFLSNEADLKTESAGFGPTRHVVIKYIGVI
jgi:spoIIIJ-associated protein